MSEIEQALSMLAGCGPEFGTNGLSNHGPMASEALIALGRDDAVEAWVARYRKKLEDRPPNVERIEREAWREALGDMRRVSDWEDYFSIEMEGTDWPSLLEDWAPRLAPGMMAGATHGIIRTAHAVRSLGREDTPERRAEFVTGLAYWAARYQVLPGLPEKVPAGLPSAAITSVPLMPSETRDSRRTNIFTAVTELDAFEPFAAAINMAAPGDDVSAFLSDLTATMAMRYLQNAGPASIAYVHTVTAPSAVRMIVPHISLATSRTLARYAWQACAAIHSRYHVEHEVVLPDTVPARDELIDRAVASGDEHAIKFTEACLRENALSPNLAFFAGPLDMSARYSGNR